VQAIPKITSDFHSLEDVGWYGAAYQLASATLQPLTGKVYTNFNNKWTFFAFFLFFEIGSLLCGVAVNSTMLIIGRAVAGMGSSGLQNGALTIVSAVAPMHKRPMLLAIVVGLGQLGLVSGPLIGGVLTQFSTWRWSVHPVFVPNRSLT
jgi:MFS family permease